MNRTEFNILNELAGRSRGAKPNSETVEAAFKTINSSQRINRAADVLVARILEAKKLLQNAKPGLAGTVDMYFQINQYTSPQVQAAIRSSVIDGVTCSRAAVENKCSSMPVYAAAKSIMILNDIRIDWSELNG